VQVQEKKLVIAFWGSTIPLDGTEERKKEITYSFQSDAGVEKGSTWDF